MEKSYSTNKEPYQNSSQPQPTHHRHPSSSSSSPFPHHHQPHPFPLPYLPPLQPFSVYPAFPRASPNEPARIAPALHCPMPYSAQLVHNFPDYINGCRSSGNVLPVGQEIRRAAPDAWTTKIARTKRKMARQKSLSSSSVDLPAVFPHFYYNGTDEAGSVVSMHVTEENSIYDKPKDPYDFTTADNKKLRVILKKDLKNSDVGSLGRIVIPKKDAEENLPSLTDKEGIQMVIRDINSNREWSVKYKFWSNNKSRMYVLENTGEFVKANRLEMGDIIVLYEDKSHNFYFSIQKAARPLEDLLQQPYPYHSSSQVTPTPTTHEEEDAALAVLIEQLRHKEHPEVTLQLMGCPSSSQHHMDPTGPQMFSCSTTEQDNDNNNDNNPEAHFNNEYYSSGFDGSSPCTFSFLDQWSGGSGEDQ